MAESNETLRRIEPMRLIIVTARGDLYYIRDTRQNQSCVVRTCRQSLVETSVFSFYATPTSNPARHSWPSHNYARSRAEVECDWWKVINHPSFTRETSHGHITCLSRYTLTTIYITSFFSLSIICPCVE